MLRKMVLTAILIAALVAPVAPFMARAQGPDGYTNYQLNMRAGPGANHSVITVLAPNTGLVFEGRTADFAWLLARTADGAFRGWVASLYVVYADGFGSPSRLPVSDELIAVQPPPAALAPDQSVAPAEAMSLPPGADASTLMSVPVMSIGTRTREIFQQGLAMGNNPRVFSIVGECNSLARGFMQPFGTGNYALGPYSYLQPTIDYFNSTPVDGAPNSFVHKGVAVNAGYTAMALTDPSWAPPGLCQGGETPLECELRRSKPAVVLVMLGLLDVYWFTPGQYEHYMRQIIESSIENGVIPVLTTFPTTAGNAGDAAGDYGGAIAFDDRAAYRLEFNTVVVNLAREYGVPLLNLWRAAQTLPRSGFREADFIHFWEPDDAGVWGDLNGGQNQCVFPMWNLIVLQMLDELRVNVLGG